MDSFAIEHVKNQDIRTFLQDNPDIDIRSFDFFEQLSSKSLQSSKLGGGEAGKKDKTQHQPMAPEALQALRAFQRNFRLTGNVAVAEGLAELGLNSAAAIAAMSPARFLETTKSLFGGDQQAARDVHAKAGHIKTAALQLYGSIKELAASPYYRNARFNGASADLIDYFTNIPSYTALFGNMNYFETDPGQTIFSPAAYFFDVMRIIDEYITYPNTIPVRTIPNGYTLEERRPDLFALKLTPENTFNEIPTLTLVNDVLAHSIAARGVGDAYQYLALAPYPFNLPFNRPLAALRCALSVMQTPLLELYRAMVVSRVDSTTVQPLDVAREALNLSVTDLQRFSVADPSVDGVTRAYGYNIPRIPPPFAGLGLIGTLAASTTVVGIGTRFQSEIAVGDAVSIGGVSHKVAGIASDTALTVDTAWAASSAVAYVVAPNMGPPKPPFMGQGTISITSDDGSVVGSGTAFTTQLAVGDQVTAAQQVRTVTAIASDTSLTVNQAWPYISAGLNYEVTPTAPQPLPPYVGAGGVIYLKGSQSVAGIGTSFLKDFANGGEIRIGAVAATVANVVSDVSLTVTSAWAAAAGADYVIAPAEKTGTVLDVLPTAGTGTLAFVKNSTRVIGTGTEFLKELRISDQIRAGNVTRTVTLILSATEIVVDLAPPADTSGLAFVILKMDGLDLVDVFLKRTGLTAPALTELLTQNLDEAERASGGADKFFINDTGEIPATITTYFCDDPSNPTHRLAGLTLKRLDRLSRFIRVQQLCGWSFADLQWAMTATGATEITDALILNLGRIAGLMVTEKLTSPDIVALFYALKTSGKIDAKAPQDQFDLIFNAPAMLQGADPYRAGSTTPFDPYRDPTQVWKISDNTGDSGNIRSRLRAALAVGDADLTRLATYVQCLTGAVNADEFPLALDTLSWLSRLAVTAARLEWTIDSYLTFLGLVYYPTAPDYFLPPKAAINFALDGLADQFALAHWVSDSGFGVAEIQYIVTGASANFPAPYPADDIGNFQADLAVSAATTHLSVASLASLQLNAEQAGALFEHLAAKGFITALGIALRYSATYGDVCDDLPVRVDENGNVFGFDVASFISAGNGISATQSQQVYAALIGASSPVLVVQSSGTAAVVQDFNAATDLSYLASIFPDDTKGKIAAIQTVLLAARGGIDALLAILSQTVSLQNTTLVGAIGGFIDVSTGTVTALLPFAARVSELPNYLEAFLTPLSAGAVLPPAVADFIAATSRAGLVADTCRLDQVETAYITSPGGAPHFNIADLANFSIVDLASISAYARLRDAVGARQDELITYFQTPSDDPVRKTAALVAATNWTADDIVLLCVYFWPSPSSTDADTVAGLMRLAAAFALQNRLSASAATLKKLISTSHLSIESAPGIIDPAHWSIYQDVAQTASGIVNASFSGQARADANAAIEEALNATSRDALVGNVLWWMNARNPTLRNVNDLYKFLLLDVEIGSCATTSQIAQAIASVQLYLQRARMMLEPGVLRVEIPTIWWSWITNYRVWEANRRIFLYPENYVEPSLRQGATPQFQNLAESLLQNDPTKANVVPPFENFIKELAILGGLSPVGAYQSRRKDQRSGEEKDTLFLIGRTRTQPYQFYFRALDNAVEWNPWYPIDMTISGDRLSPVYAFGRLFVFWTEFDTAKSNSIANQASNTETVDKATVKYAFYNNGEWSSIQILDQVALINTYPSTYPTISQPGAVADMLRKENTYWQFPYVISTGEGMVGAGRISISAGIGTVDGTRTQFGREVRAGDTIVCFGESRIVGAVASDTSLVVTQPWLGSATDAEFKIIPLSQAERFRPFVGTGKASTTTGMELVTGVGTRFLDELVYGDTIAIGGESYLVILIQDQENLLVDQKWIGSYNNADYTVVPGRQGDENILVCYSPPVDTRKPPNYGSKVVTDNPTKNNFISAQNMLNASVYNGLWLASQYQPSQQNITGAVPLTNCVFLDADLSRSNAKTLWTDYAYSAAANPQPYRADLVRKYARLSVYPSDNILWDNYWGANLPDQFDSNRLPLGNQGVDLLFNVAKNAASLIPVGNKPGSFLFDNVDEAFLVRANDKSIDLISENILRSQRPWKPDLEDSQIISTGAYGVNAQPLNNTDFVFDRLTTVVMPILQARLFAGGIDRLLSLSSQYLPELPFNRFYPPPGTTPPPHVIPVASPLMDFDGSFGLYFWEIFFHSPFLVADRLRGNGRFEEALSWLQYIFNPTQQPERDDDDPEKRYWRFRPFRNMDQPSLRKVLTDPLQIRRYNYDPFDPDAIAAIRPVAYAKAIVMRYVDTVLDWADTLFAQYTRETITQATNLYVFAEDLLGTKPVSLGRLPLPEPKSFNELKAEYPTNQIPQFLIDLENTPYLHPDDDNARYPSQPVNDIIAYFAVPENADFMKYWDRVEDRLFKIRHCMNIDGQVAPLALFSPPIDPALLIQAMAAGGGSSLAQALAETVPYYRFSYLVERAEAMANQLAGLNAALLSALEKKDAEALSQLTSQQEGLLLKLTTVIKEQEIADAMVTGEALQESLASAQYRQNYYATLVKNGLSPREQRSLDAMLDALIYNALGTVTKTAASIGYAVPQVGSPFAMTYGGQQIGNALNAASGVFEIGAAIATFNSQQAQTLAAYDRRSDDWSLQEKLAGFDVAQFQDQIKSNAIRLAIAKQNLVIHEETIKQNRERAKFLKDKFTNAALYQWMANQVGRVQFQTYTLAYQLALTAQRAYQFEYGAGRSFVNFDYWDSAHRGVTSADGLLLALAQMRSSTLDVSRPLEIERIISLSQINPTALIKLRETGECLFDFSERLFDYDFPGHYNRVIKTLTVSIPCVVGPYQNIKATLTQLGNQVVLKAGDAGLDAISFLLGSQSAKTPPANVLRSNWRNYQEVVLSNGQDDSGLFTVNLDDSRYLPFEGTGAVSTWRLSLPKGTNRIPFDAIGDVIVSLKYVARDGGDAFRRKVANLDALKPFTAANYVDCRSMYFDAWQLFFASVGSASLTQTLSLPVADFTPPHVEKSKLIGFYILLSADASVPGSYIKVKLTDTLTADVTLSAVNDMTYLFDQQHQTPPSIAKVTQRPIEIEFDLSKTPASLKNTTNGLNPESLKNIQIVFYYAGNVIL
jgi:hypothetical protein